MVVLLINLIYNSFIGLSNLDFRVLQFFHLLIQFGCSTIVEDAILLLKSFDSSEVGFVKKKRVECCHTQFSSMCFFFLCNSQ